MTSIFNQSESELGGYPRLGEDGLILEGVVTTLNADGSPNISPMGPIVDAQMQRLYFRPFQSSTTYQNLQRCGEGVLHVTDDVMLIAQTAIGVSAHLPKLAVAENVNGVILADACRWYAFVVESIDDREERTSVLARVVDAGLIREFFGFNRAKHAVIEAAIIATRVKFLPCAEVDEALARLTPLVEKTGSADEHAAFALVRDFVQNHVSRQ